MGCNQDFDFVVEVYCAFVRNIAEDEQSERHKWQNWLEDLTAMVAYGEMLLLEPGCENDSCAVPKNEYEQISLKIICSHRGFGTLRIWIIVRLTDRVLF